VEIITQADVALLRRFEPVACFNLGELFLPMDVDRYLAAARLCVRHPDGEAEELVPRGQLTVERLTQTYDVGRGSVYYLNLVEPLNAAQVRLFRRTSALRHFRAGQGRLARVGILSRLADLLFSLTLLLRGRVPGGMAAAAALHYQQMQAEQERYCYYGRVIREHGYIALQYWFFYAFNDWRSSFHGVNDHEADWEMVTVYVVEDVSGTVQPCWVAYSSHEFEGDDLRRRWDDPEVQKVGEHPLVFVAAGSHANYYRPGEYMPVSELPYLGLLLRARRVLQRFWRDTLRQGSESDTPDVGFVRIPFVDYARGDGVRIGPGEARSWELHLLQASTSAPAPAWVEAYRGLWGLYTRDPIAGEDAPAGPKYTRDGAVRKMWYNPLGWSGLDKVPPPYEEAIFLEMQRQRLLAEQEQLQHQIADQVTTLMGLEMEAEAIYGLPHMRARAAELRRRLHSEGKQLDQLKGHYAENAVVLERCAAYAEGLSQPRHSDPRAHLRLPQLPTSAADLRLSRLAEVWSALSIGLLLVGFVVITQVAAAWQSGLLALLGIYLFIEALFRRRVQRLIRYGVLSLAMLTMLVLLYEFFWPIVVVLLVLAGLLVIVENVRELRMS
jgi:hypothetical protein